MLSCTEAIEKKEYYKFAKQITPSGKYIIYDYGRSGEWAFTSEIIGTELFGVNEPFHERDGIDINGTISHWITNDTLLVYNFNSNNDQPKDTLPIKIEHEKLGDFIVKRVFYKTNGGGGDTHYFDSVWTNENRIWIRFKYNEKKKYTRSFILGSATIQTTTDSIESIEVFDGISKSMQFSYKNADGTAKYGLPGIGTRWKTYKPLKKISPYKLNKKKIFWDIKETATNKSYK